MCTAALPFAENVPYFTISISIQFASAMLPAECQPVVELEQQQQMDLPDPDLQSVLDVSSLLKLNADGDHVEDTSEGKGVREMGELTSFCNRIQQLSLRANRLFICFSYVL